MIVASWAIALGSASCTSASPPAADPALSASVESPALESAETSTESPDSKKPQSNAPPTPGDGANEEYPEADPPFPLEALMLLNQAMEDSCAICAGKNRKKAFAILDEAYAPGTLLSTTERASLIRVPLEEHGLAFSSYALEAPSIVFRFHSESAQLIGIDPADHSDPAIVEIYANAPAGQRWQGLLEVISYPYGDGASSRQSASGSVEIDRSRAS